MARLTLDMRFVEIEAEVWALGQFLPVIETQIDYLTAQDRIRVEADLVAQGLAWEDPDVQIAFQEHSARATKVFPRFMRAPFVIALCACYESAIEELAEYMARANKRSLTLRDIRGKSWLDSAQKYFESVLNSSLDEDPERTAFIGDLFAVRNAVAHANGSVRSIPADKLTRLKQITQRYVGEIEINDELVVLTSTFLENAFTNVRASVGALVNRTRGGPVVRTMTPRSGESNSSADS